MTRRDTTLRRSALRWLACGALIILSATLAACDGTNQQGGGSTTSSGKGTQISMVLDPAGVLVAVAQDHGFFHGISVDYQRVGYDAAGSLFVARKLPIGVFSPTELVEPKNQQAKLRFFSTAGAIDFVNGIVVRAQDANKYKSLSDLRGHKVGQPGFGTGTWQAFSAISKSVYNIQPRQDFSLVTADPGALLGLLEKGRIDAAVTFSSQAITALAEPDKFKLISSFSDDWQKKTEQPLVVTGLVGRQPWLDSHQHAAKAFVDGIDHAMAWAKKHPDAFLKGGRYESWSNAAGWFTTPKTAQAIVQLMKKNKYWYTSDLYTDKWIDSTYKFIKSSTKNEQVPAKSDIFYHLKPQD
ncbi:MAG: ABC transporter substrate-binding protein [Nocardioidaceae bacterium]